uniref:Uncharacterized protein n=1 Tax=Parascaris equorum TaxID=6256 RepID=A0A914RIZ6_PAREQ
LFKEDGVSSDEEAEATRDADAAEVRLNRRHLDDAADYEGEEEEQKAVTPDDRHVYFYQLFTAGGEPTDGLLKFTMSSGYAANKLVFESRKRYVDDWTTGFALTEANDRVVDVR